MIRLTVLSGLGHVVFVAVGLLVYVMTTRIGHQRRHPSAAMGWVLGIVAFPYLFVPLFLLFGTRKLARPVRHASASAQAWPGEGPPWATRLLASMELAPAVRNHSIVMHADGGQALQGLQILGGGMVGTHAGDMIGEIALAIEMGADAVDIGKTIHPHPTLGESIGMAAEVAHGSCTDVPPARK